MPDDSNAEGAADASSPAPSEESPASPPQQTADRPSPGMAVLALLGVLVAVAAPVAAGLIYAAKTVQARGVVDIVRLALQGGTTPPRVPSAAFVESVRTQLGWDTVVIAGYGILLIGGCALALLVARSPGGHRWATFGLVAAITTVVADGAENGSLWWVVLKGHTRLLWADSYDVASAASVLKWSAALPAAVVAVVGVVLTLLRAPLQIFAHQQQEILAPADFRQAGSGSDGSAPGVERDRWRRGYAVPECGHPRHDDDHTAGVCLSGGGIRAASVAMGALQDEDFRKIVSKARYLVSVSGGGYTAGAFQQALNDARPTSSFPKNESPISDPRTAFLPGTEEEDHVRRHSSYLASNPAEILVALGLLARHLLLTLTVLIGPAILLGVAAGAFYRAAPVTQIGPSGTLTPAALRHLAFPVPRTAALWVIGLLVVLAVLFWLGAQLVSAHPTDEGSPGDRRLVPRKGQRLLTAASAMSSGLAGVVVTVAVLVPALVWVASKVTPTGGVVQVAGPIGSVLLTYIASLASVAWRHRTLVTDATGNKTLNAAPRGAVQLLLVVAALVLLAAGWLLLFGGLATVGLRGPSTGSWVTLAALLAVVIFLGGISDETTLSLHPFYRRRLASAFAVRRVKVPGGIEARAYAPDERSTLSSYGALPSTKDFPHVIFAASATLGGQRTPPGANRVSYTFCSDWVGGPDVGFVRTERLETLVSSRLRRDLTVQGAVALSGAAIAASIGGQGTKWYETLFVVTGLRLGAWMPNPAYMIETYRTTRTWRQSGLPRARRLNYLLCELAGVHAPEAPMLQVTDGGFYDNLGLVELFRRGCTRIYCIDASGDNPPAATTLAEALTLAFQELGVVTDLERGTWTTFTAGGGDALSPKDPLAALSARLSQTGIITGTFCYPEGHPNHGTTGVLIVAKASLWPELPYPVLAYAQNAAVFPRDSTGDQFFDDDQYAAYTALGRALASAAVTAKAGYDADGNPVPKPKPPPSPAGNGQPVVAQPAGTA